MPPPPPPQQIELTRLCSHLDQLHARDGAQQRARLLVEAVVPAQAAGIVVGHRRTGATSWMSMGRSSIEVARQEGRGLLDRITEAAAPGTR